MLENLLETDFWFEHAAVLEDLELIDEVINLCYTDKRVDKIVEAFYDGSWSDLTEDEREYLQNFYVLNMVEAYLEE